MFCPKCGTPYEEGDLFCGKCGAALQARTVYTKPFESSETEKIEDAKPGAEMSRQFAQAAAGVGDAVKKLNIDFKGKVPEGLKDYLRLGVTKPIDAVQLGTDSDKFTSSLGIIGVKDIILSLLTVFSIAGLISSVTSHYGYSGFQVMKELDMSAPKVFFTLLFLFIVMDFVVMMSLFGLGKLFKGEGSVKD